jgi:hypothetical protein
MQNVSKAITLQAQQTTVLLLPKAIFGTIASGIPMLKPYFSTVGVSL